MPVATRRTKGVGKKAGSTVSRNRKSRDSDSESDNDQDEPKETKRSPPRPLRTRVSLSNNNRSLTPGKKKSKRNRRASNVTPRKLSQVQVPVPPMKKNIQLPSSKLQSGKENLASPSTIEPTLKSKSKRTSITGSKSTRPSKSNDMDAAFEGVRIEKDIDDRKKQPTVNNKANDPEQRSSSESIDDHNGNFLDETIQTKHESPVVKPLAIAAAVDQPPTCCNADDGSECDAAFENESSRKSKCSPTSQLDYNSQNLITQASLPPASVTLVVGNPNQSESHDHDDVNEDIADGISAMSSSFASPPPKRSQARPKWEKDWGDQDQDADSKQSSPILENIELAASSGSDDGTEMDERSEDEDTLSEGDETSIDDTAPEDEDDEFPEGAYSSADEDEYNPEEDEIVSSDEDLDDNYLSSTVQPRASRGRRGKEKPENSGAKSNSIEASTKDPPPEDEPESADDVSSAITEAPEDVPAGDMLVDRVPSEEDHAENFTMMTPSPKEKRTRDTDTVPAEVQQMTPEAAVTSSDTPCASHVASPFSPEIMAVVVNDEESLDDVDVLVATIAGEHIILDHKSDVADSSVDEDTDDDETIMETDEIIHEDSPSTKLESSGVAPSPEPHQPTASKKQNKPARVETKKVFDGSKTRVKFRDNGTTLRRNDVDRSLNSDAGLVRNAESFDSDNHESSQIEMTGTQDSSIASGRAPRDLEQGSEKNSAAVRSEGMIVEGQWKLGTNIGTGSFGAVHMGMNNQTGAVIAVKVIKLNRSVKEDMMREILLLRSLKHRNIVRYFGSQMDEETLYIFQEWVPAGSVATMLQRFGPFAMPVARSYLFQTLAGLDYLHENGILHRDIKGSNLLIDRDGVVKLADFGASKKLQELQPDQMMNMTVRGTPYFMAPEVFEETYSSKADIWSVGCVAYQMTTSNPPWKEEGFTNPVSLFNHIKRYVGSPPIPEGLDSGNDTRDYDRLLSIMDMCFQREPSLRPSARELMSEAFFTEMHRELDGDHVPTSGFFSPRNDANVALYGSPIALRSFSPARHPVHKQLQQHQPRGFLSPPLPDKHLMRVLLSPTPVASAQKESPAADSSDWPGWAKEGLVAENFSVTRMLDSLAISEDSLEGLKFMNSLSSPLMKKKDEE